MVLSNPILTVTKKYLTLRLFRTFIEIRKGKKRQAVKMNEIQKIDEIHAGKIRVRRKLKRDIILELAPQDSRKFLSIAEQQLKQNRLENITSYIAAQKELKKVRTRSRELRGLAWSS